MVHRHIISAHITTQMGVNECAGERVGVDEGLDRAEMNMTAKLTYSPSPTI